MSELDLDALEREAGTTGHVNVERLTWDALIQRLRDAEERERQHRREMDTLDSFHKVRIAQLELAVTEFLGEDRGGELYQRRKLRTALDGKDRPWYTNDPDDPSGMIPR